MTLGSASQPGALSMPTPPVGQNTMSANGLAQAFSIAGPPAAEAGKNLRKRNPSSAACITSLAVATPGSSGKPAARQAAATAAL